jgi:hypothetical protein
MFRASVLETENDTMDATTTALLSPASIDGLRSSMRGEVLDPASAAYHATRNAGSSESQVRDRLCNGSTGREYLKSHAAGSFSLVGEMAAADRSGDLGSQRTRRDGNPNSPVEDVGSRLSGVGGALFVRAGRIGSRSICARATCAIMSGTGRSPNYVFSLTHAEKSVHSSPVMSPGRTMSRVI